MKEKKHYTTMATKAFKKLPARAKRAAFAAMAKKGSSVRKTNASDAIYLHASKIAKSSGLSLKEYNSMHSGSRKELFRAMVSAGDFAKRKKR